MRNSSPFFLRLWQNHYFPAVHCKIYLWSLPGVKLNTQVITVTGEKSWKSVPESNADDPEYTYTECLIKHSM